MMVKNGVLLLFVLSLIGCNHSEKSKKPPINQLNSEMMQLDNPSGERAHLPRLFSNQKELYFSWVSQKDSIDYLYYAVLEKGSWSTPTVLASGADWFTNWADFPSIAENEGNILSSFLQKSATGTYTYDIKLNLYNAKTNTWKNNFILHNDGTQSEHGFVSIRPYVDGSFFVTWLDGRETVGKGHGGGQMTLRGAIVFEDGTIEYDTLLDSRICDCCQTTAAIGNDHEILVSYRDRSDDEIRDISVVKWQESTGWSSPKTLGSDQWKIAGCPVNGPAMDLWSNGVVVAWFTGVGDEGKVQLSFSNDLGESFEPPMRVDGGNATGRVDVLMLSNQEAAVLWMEPQGNSEVIQLRKVTAKGVMSKPITISKTSAERASGFPQLERVGDTLYMAWTNIDHEQSHIKMASIDLSQL